MNRESSALVPDSEMSFLTFDCCGWAASAELTLLILHLNGLPTSCQDFPEKKRSVEQQPDRYSFSRLWTASLQSGGALFHRNSMLAFLTLKFHLRNSQRLWRVGYFSQGEFIGSHAAETHHCVISCHKNSIPWQDLLISVLHQPSNLLSFTHHQKGLGVIRHNCPDPSNVSVVHTLISLWGSVGLIENK